ncbi:hypothetical protein B0J15DRAFT_465621 [Fusarium solani]|uniref:Uncharacterized protein n=1 Tax=Fusarium solani TaxID=169388 RepID=A0A9P9HIR3_FUSSL|nr:uncharacterized protein B0J15DRAFT_465621 [Fusarium solani]KAH7258349.1 hypothetical protein B0J15DRAFT_465621 [Fusarium solani]
MHELSERFIGHTAGWCYQLKPKSLSSDIPSSSCAPVTTSHVALEPTLLPSDCPSASPEPRLCRTSFGLFWFRSSQLGGAISARTHSLADDDASTLQLCDALGPDVDARIFFDMCLPSPYRGTSVDSTAPLVGEAARRTGRLLSPEGKVVEEKYVDYTPGVPKAMVDLKAKLIQEYDRHEAKRRFFYSVATFPTIQEPCWYQARIKQRFQRLTGDNFSGSMLPRWGGKRETMEDVGSGVVQFLT